MLGVTAAATITWLASTAMPAPVVPISPVSERQSENQDATDALDERDQRCPALRAQGAEVHLSQRLGQSGQGEQLEYAGAVRCVCGPNSPRSSGAAHMTTAAAGVRMSIVLRSAARQFAAMVSSSNEPSTVSDVAMLTDSRSSVVPTSHAE